MTMFHWTADISSNFFERSNWTPTGLPGKGDDAILDASGGLSYTVHVETRYNGPTMLRSFQTNIDAKFVVSGVDSMLILQKGTDTGVNAGKLLLLDESKLAFSGTIDNTGFVYVQNSSIRVTDGSRGLFFGGGIVDLVGSTEFLSYEPGQALTNVDNQIVVDGFNSILNLSFTNARDGVIRNSGKANSGFAAASGATFINKGRILATDDGHGGGGLSIGDLENDGTLIADKGGLSVGNVTGTGTALIIGGTLSVGAFAQDVRFKGVNPTGTLILSDAQDYTGRIINFSKTGTTSLEVSDIDFVSINEAMFAKGVLTVTDGVHVASIHLTGSFAGVTFTAEKSGSKGTVVTAFAQTGTTSSFHWTVDISGNFDSPGFWSIIGVPNSRFGDEAILDASGGKAYIVTATSSEDVIDIQTAADATLAIGRQSDFVADQGTGTGANAGTILDIAGGTFEVGGTVDNTGSIVVANSELQVANSDATLTGDGTLSLSGGDGSSYALLQGKFGGAFGLTNADNRIVGAGTVVVGNLTLTNGPDGTITSRATGALRLDLISGASLINQGRILGSGDAAGAGGMTIDGAIENDGALVAYNAGLTITGAVTGTGSASIIDGTLTLGSSFAQDVRFAATSPHATLVLAEAQGYTGRLINFSRTGAATLDLQDIGFVDSSEATFANGVLSVSDGTHVAAIHLAGSYADTRFTSSSDGTGGTLVTASTSPAASTTLGMHAAWLSRDHAVHTIV